MDFKDYRSGATESFFWFEARKELIEVLCKKLSLPKNVRILDIGGGTGTNLPVLKKFGDISVIDPDLDALSLIPPGAASEKKVGSATALPYENEHFDAITAFDVLEHITDDARVLEEINRVLKPGGFFIFTVPAFNTLFSSHDKALNHFRRYNKTMLKNLFSKMEHISLGYWMFFLFLPIAITKLLGKNKVPVLHSFKLPQFLNTFFFNILRLENWLIRRGIPLPVGITLYGVYRKKII